MPPPLPPIAAMLDWLMDRDGRSDEDVAAAVNRVAERRSFTSKDGTPITITRWGIRKIRRGETANPGVQIVQAIAEVFGIGVGTLLDEPPPGFTPEQVLAAAVLYRDGGDQLLAAYQRLPSDVRDLVRDFISGLADAAGEPPG